MAILPKFISGFNAALTKTPVAFFTFRNGKANPKIHMESNNWQNNIEKMNKLGGLTLLDFKAYHRAVIIKTVWQWHTGRQRGHGLESPEINL